LEYVFWNVKTGEVTSLARDKNPSGNWISFSSNGKVVAYPAGEKTIAMCDLESNERTLHEFPLTIIGQAAFSPDDRLLAVACMSAVKQRQGTVLLWDMTNNVEQARFSAGAGLTPIPLAFSPDGKRLAVGDAVGNITVIDAFDGKETLRLPAAHKGYVNQLLWRPDGRHLISGGGLGAIKQWELSGDALVTFIETRSQGPVSAFVFSPDRKWLAVNSPLEKETRLINRASGLVERRFPKSGVMIFRSDSRQLAVFHPLPGEAIVWDVNSGKEVTRLKPKGEHRKISWKSAAFGADGHLLILRKHENRLEAWDATENRVIWTMPADSEALLGYLSPDGHHMATFEAALNQLSLWELPAGRKISQISPPEGAIWMGATSFSSDGRWLAMSHIRMPGLSKQSQPASNDEGRQGETGVGVWHIASGDLALHVKNTSIPTSYCFNPGSRLLAIGYQDGSIQLWDIAAGEELFRFRWNAYSGPIIQVAFTPDGTALATSDRQSSIQLLDLPKLRKQLGESGLDWPEK
jgi:WD40 repeat protein